jgi:hypothetical protein
MAVNDAGKAAMENGQQTRGPAPTSVSMNASALSLKPMVPVAMRTRP